MGAGKRNSFFYFNGFNSAILEDYSGNAKIVAVAGHAARAGYRFVPVSVSFRQAPEHAEGIVGVAAESEGAVVFCGSSMGGWFARILQLRLAAAAPGLRTAAIAFNPAYDLWLHGHVLRGPQTNFVTGEKYVWTEAHDRQIRRLEQSVDYNAALPFFVYVDKGDEVIGWEASSARHRPIARFRAFEGGCHSFDHYREALEDFEKNFPIGGDAYGAAPDNLVG